MIIKKLKINRSKLFSLILLFFIFSAITLIFYNGLGKVYFQQDEWFKTGKSIYYLYSDFGSLWFKRFGFHYYPLLNLYFIAEYLFLKMNVSLYMYVGVVLQGIVGVLLYDFFKKLFKYRFVAFLLTFLFLINPGIHQVTLNEMVSSSYKIPLIIMLGSFIFLYNAVHNSQVLSNKTINILALTYVISVAFFESALVMIILLPLFFILFKSRKLRFEFSRRNKLILFFLAALTVFRLVIQNILPVDAPLPIEGSFIVSTLYNAFSTPFKFVAEYLLNLENIYTLGRIYESKIFALRNNPSIDHGAIAATAGYEMVVYFTVSIIAIISSLIFALADRKSKNTNRYFAIIVFGIVWILVNAFVIAPQGRIFNSLESRYLYISGVGMLMIVGATFLILWERFKKINLFKILLFASIGIYLIWWGRYSIKIIDQEKNIILQRSVVREKFVRQFMNLYPTLPKDAVIYIYCSDDCSSNATIGLRPEWVIPFQNGLGWVLLIMYAQDNPQRYSPYFSNYLFWDNKSAGYRKIGDSSFGFFTDLGELKKTMRKNSLIPSDIIVLKYESKKFKLTPVKNSEQILFP